jgi:SNF2 family DNA or RNA helicase
MYDMGFGKTISAASIAETSITTEPSRKVIILVAKSLVNNYKENLKVLKPSYTSDQIDKNYEFITMNAQNMYKKISTVNESNDITKQQSLENVLLIVDEAHLLFNSIVNSSKNGLSLYNLIMATKDIKLIFLTGTPMINTPFELVPCFNMLNGSTLFPETVDEFNKFCISAC